MAFSREKIIKAGLVSGTDKISHHSYERFYSDFLSQEDIKNEILEIGYGNGDGVKFWQYLYPDCFLNVIDKDLKMTGKNYEVFKCDQSSLIDLKMLIEKLERKKVELIVDDGSHVPEHQILSFNFLFKNLLSPGCTYIIEDIETSFWKSGSIYGYPTNYGYDSKKSIINSFSKILNWINKEFLLENERKVLLRELDGAGFDIESVENIKSITFGHNILGIRKKTKKDLQLSKRNYRFSKYLYRSGKGF